MTFNLVKVDTHGNKIALYKKIENNNIFFIKESTDINSNQIIEREYQGYKWFFDNILKKKNLVEIERGSFKNITIPKFSGDNYSNEKKFHLQKLSMLKIINFYRKFWPKDNSFSIHGDMGLSNFIFSKDEIILIDWEHFHKNDIQYYGFDIINMLSISFYYKIFSLSFNYKKEIHFIKKCYNLLFSDISFDCLIKKRPFYESKNYIINNYHQYGNSENKNRMKKKFILASFSDDQINDLDHQIISSNN